MPGERSTTTLPSRGPPKQQEAHISSLLFSPSPCFLLSFSFFLPFPLLLCSLPSLLLRLSLSFFFLLRLFSSLSYFSFSRALPILFLIYQVYPPFSFLSFPFFSSFNMFYLSLFSLLSLLFSSFSSHCYAIFPPFSSLFLSFSL